METKPKSPPVQIEPTIPWKLQKAQARLAELRARRSLWEALQELTEKLTRLADLAIVVVERETDPDVIRERERQRTRRG